MNDGQGAVAVGTENIAGAGIKSGAVHMVADRESLDDLPGLAFMTTRFLLWQPLKRRLFFTSMESPEGDSPGPGARSSGPSRSWRPSLGPRSWFQVVKDLALPVGDGHFGSPIQRDSLIQFVGGRVDHRGCMAVAIES